MNTVRMLDKPVEKWTLAVSFADGVFFYITGIVHDCISISTDAEDAASYRFASDAIRDYDRFKALSGWIACRVTKVI